MYLVRNYLVDQCCKSEVFGLNRIVDDFGYIVPHHLIENTYLYIKGLISSIVSTCIIFVLLKEWVIFTSIC